MDTLTIRPCKSIQMHPFTLQQQRVQPMFIANLTYIAPIERIDALLEGHKAFLKEQYAQGVFLASGRKNPRTGGIILACCPSREALEKILAQDPFQIHGAAHYEIIEFIPSVTANGLESLQK